MKIDVNKAMANVTIEVRCTGLRRLKARLRLGRLFIMLGVWITGARYLDVIVKEDNDAE